MPYGVIREIVVNENEEFKIEPEDSIISVTPVIAGEYKIVILTYLRDK